MAGVSITLAGNFGKLDELKKKAESTSESIKKAFGSDMAKKMFAGMAIAGTAAFAAIALGAKKAVEAASNMSETLGKSSVVFGANAAAMEEWAATASRTFGQSKNEALSAAATIGNLFVSMGIGSDRAAEMSRSMVELAADLASFSNTSIDEAIVSINAALIGESEPIRKYGVLLNEATLKAEAMKQGLSDGKGTLEPMAKAMAAYSVILGQTGTAQGDFARTADGLANSQRTIEAVMKDMVGTIGKELLPTVQQLANDFKGLDMEDTAAKIATMASVMLELAKATIKAGDATAGFVQKYTPLGAIATQIGRRMSRAEGAHPGLALDAAPFTIGEGGKATMNDAGSAGAIAPTGPPAPSSAELKKRLDAEEKAAEAARKKAEEKAKSRAVALDEYNIESSMLAARLRGDAARVEALEREKEIREEINRLIKAGFTEIEARRPAEAKVEAERKASKKEEAEEELKSERKKAQDILDGKLSDVRGRIDNQQFDSTIGATSAMRRIGGGGVATSSGLDYARQAADLQREANGILRQIAEASKSPPEAN